MDRPIRCRATRRADHVFNRHPHRNRASIWPLTEHRIEAVSGSDDDYTWALTTKTNENGKLELDLLLLDKNGNKLFDGPFSRTRDMKGLPDQVSQRLSSYPWDLVIEDLKSPGGGNGGVVNFGFPAVPGAAPVAPQPRPAPAAK